MIKQIIKNAGSPIKTALSEFRKGHLVSPTKRILAVVIGLMVGLIMDTKKIFKWLDRRSIIHLIWKLIKKKVPFF